MIDFSLIAPFAIPLYRMIDWKSLSLHWSINEIVLKQVGGAAIGITSYLLFHGWLIYTRGQTIGKRICGTVVITKDGQQVSGNRYLFRRLLPLWCIGSIPYVSVPLGLVDTFAVFRLEKNRIADDIAGTRVIMKADLKKRKKS